MRVLAGPDSEMVRGVVGHMVKRSSHQDRSSGGGPGIGQEREADKSLRQGNDKWFETRICIDMCIDLSTYLHIVIWWLGCDWWLRGVCFLYMC